ncbi:hypothetical protein [Winogradskyella schleiferi]|uniref:hypothetical protein n=1 Tax=Winogradskyella schleiferi TaxID=2686078 RepID=UPI0015BA97A9|nr:hypothetical protein [Winogradskyella schleiferi]
MKFNINVVFYLLIPVTIFSQNNSSNNYKEFDKIVGTINNDLSQGIRFVDDFNRTYSKNDFRFFKSNVYTTAFLQYNGQPFFDANIKYDLLEDQIVFRNNTEDKSFEIILSSLHIDAFKIYGSTFLRLPHKASKFSFYNNGFFEQLYKGQNFNLFLKHQKNIKKRLVDKTVLYEFLESEILLLEYDTEYYQLTSKNDIIDVLPQEKSKIKSFYKKNKILKVRDSKAFMISLFSHLDTE